jgi:hypothetical protein
VHSSTSSFRTLPHGWFALCAGALLAGVLLVGWELFWRSRGYVATLTDSEALWCRERNAVSTGSVVIVGSSRLQAGLDPRVFARALGGKHVVQLAINGANPGPTLSELAADESFAGVVMLEYMPLRLFTADASSVARAESFVLACKHITLVAQVDAAMSRVVQKRLALMSPELHPIAVLSYAKRHKALPANTYAHLRDDRFLSLSFTHAVKDDGDQQALRWGPPDPEPVLMQRLVSMRDAVQRIQARGGRVVLYRPPVTKGVLADEQAHYPAEVWLPRAAAALGVSAIDFAALSDIKDITSPDGGHLAGTDVPRVTESVGRELSRLLSGGR